MRDFDELVEQYHNALQDFVEGNARPMQDTFSHREDITLANPFGDIMHGWESVKKALERAATAYREGTHSFENIVTYTSSELGYIVEVEKFKAKLAGKTEMSNGALRVTSIFRKEDGVWKCIHRHADPQTSLQTIESAVQKYENQKQ